MRFVDEVTVKAKAGDGGNGIVAWRREKFVPRGGPAGGDGGDGGDVIFVTDSGMHSLLDFHYCAIVQAEDGERGGTSDMCGKGGEHITQRVPIGTQVYDHETGELLADLTAAGEEAVICRGGRGGLGNARFTSSTKQSPSFAKDGTPGEERTLKLSLKLMADVGLVGMPNAGKSTLLSRLSAARPKVADYPFTTLVPMLGVVKARDMQSFVMADIPGLIEGASEGIGLGTRFLKHIERVSILCHLIEPELIDEQEDSLLQKYKVIRQELNRFNEDLCTRPEIVVLSKHDIFGDSKMIQIEVLTKYLDDNNIQYMQVSAVTGHGISDLVDVLWTHVSKKTKGRVAQLVVESEFNPLG